MSDTLALIRSAVAAGLDQAGLVRAATLTKFTAGTRTAGSVSAGTNPTSTAYSCKGLVVLATQDDLVGTLVESTTRRISLVGATLAVIPGPNDTVTIADIDGGSKTFTLRSRVDGDAAGAMFTFVATL